MTRSVDDLSVSLTARVTDGLYWSLAFVVPATFQLIYGVRDVGLVEEWGVQIRFDQIGPVFWTPIEHGGLVAQSIRPMTVAPHALAYLLDPDSFVWYHLLNAVALGLKGLAMLALLTRLGVRRSICLTGAVAFALFPAWTGLFTFRMIHGQFAVAALVFALSQLLAFYDRPTWQRGVLIALGLTLSLFVYEVGYVVVLVAPALLVLRDGLSWRRFLQTAAVWFIAPVLNGIRIILLFTSGQTLYERDLVIRTERSPGHELAELLSHIYGDGLRGLVDGPSGMMFTFLTICVLVAVGTVVLHNASRESTNGLESAAAAGLTDRRLLWLTVGAFASAPIVTLIYAPHPVHLADPLRIFSIASLPLSIGVVGLVELLARWRRGLAVLSSVVLLATVTGSAGGQRQAWHRYSEIQGDALGAIVAAKVSVPEASNIIVVDPDHLVGDDIYTFIPEYLRLSLQYVLPNIGNVLLCRAPVDELPATGVLPTDCVLQGGAVTNNLGSIPVVSAAVIEIRHTKPGAGWTGAPVTSEWPRVSSVLPCVGAGTCDSGGSGIQARLAVEEVP